MVFMLTLVLSLLKLGSGQWQVLGPHQPMQALVGEDTMFSCFLSPETNVEAMEVRFFKDQFSAVVHLYRDGEDQKYMQLPAYRGRTVMMKNFMADGHVSLALRNITLSDVGLYGCSFRSQTYHQDATWELQVLALGSTPLISITGYVDGGIQLLCQSSVWLSQLTVKWKGPQGHDLSSESKITTERHGPFDVESSFIVQEDSGSIACSIQRPDQSQVIESRVWVKEIFFQPSPWRLASILLGLLCCILSVGIIVKKVFFSKYQRKILEELEWRKKSSEAALREHQKYAVEVTLDPDTAHPQLYISGLKSVTFKETPRNVTYSEKRFMRKCVVASQSFETGKHYWEVDVGHNESWCLGVCRDDVHRHKYETYSSNNGYWVLEHWRGCKYFILDPHRVSVSPRNCPTKVGVFLDYEGGAISFFNVNDQSLIHTLTHQFEGLLRPYFKPWSYETNGTPIVICPVSQWPGKESLSQEIPTSPDTDSQKPSPEVATPFLSENDH